MLVGLVVALLLALHDGLNNLDGVRSRARAHQRCAGSPCRWGAVSPYYTVTTFWCQRVPDGVLRHHLFLRQRLGGYFLSTTNFIPPIRSKHRCTSRQCAVLHPYYSMLRAITTQMMWP